MPAAWSARPPVRAAIRVWSWCAVPTPVAGPGRRLIERLQRAGLTATAVQNRLTSLHDRPLPGRPARRGRAQGVMRQTGRTFSACGPFCPWVVSNSTF
jgi:hypothetical protein